jgi:DNA-binding LacI/PurR family transcriptional regulator
MQKLSKVDTLKLKIIEDISLGVLQPGDKVYSRHQFMRRYACSRGSIDKAVGALVKEGFLTARQGAGTFVSEKRPVANSVERVYLIGSYGRQNIYSQIFQTGSLASELQKHVDCFLCDYTDVNVSLENIARPGTAVIWDHPGHEQMMIMSYLEMRGIRQILVHRVFGDYEYITIDYKGGISAGLDWLRQWSSEIAFFTTLTHTSSPFIAERQLCFYELAICKGVNVRPEWFFNDIERSDDDYAKVGQQALKIFGGRDFPKAVFADYCPHADTILKAAHSHGLREGKDFRLLIFDYEPFLSKCCGIAMIMQDTHEFKEKLLKWVSSPQLVMKTRIKPKLVIPE